MTQISFEYFPPKTAEQTAVLTETHRRLSRLQPEYCSVTYGAGGSTVNHTERSVMEIHQRADIPVAPHISCLGGAMSDLKAMLDKYQAAGINRLVALRGDMPSGMAVAGELRWANELVSFIRQQTGDHFHIAVACYPEIHPEAETANRDMDFFRQKVDAGANEAITQFFFNADAYFRFLEDCQSRQIDIPIVPGIMPIINFSRLSRFASMCGAEMPRWLRLRLRDFGDDRDSIRDFGIDFVTGLCQRLIDGGAPALHFYTLNRSLATLKICKSLGLGASPSAAAAQA